MERLHLRSALVYLLGQTDVLVQHYFECKETSVAERVCISGKVVVSQGEELRQHMVKLRKRLVLD